MSDIAHLPQRTTSLDAWWFVDTPDGRRWLGEVAWKSDDLSEFHFSKSVEFAPWTTTAVVVPAPPDPQSILSGRAQQPQLTVQNVQSDAGSFQPSLGMPLMAPWKVRNACGACPLSAYPGFLRASLLVAVQKTEKFCADAERDAKRAQGNASREKAT
jgi:hypothetical protein